MASPKAQIGALRKRANVLGTAMQTRLQADIAACEWLARNWLAHRLERETDKLLLTVEGQKRESVRDAAIALAEAGIAYNSSIGERSGESVLVS